MCKIYLAKYKQSISHKFSQYYNTFWCNLQIHTLFLGQISVFGHKLWLGRFCYLCVKPYISWSIQTLPKHVNITRNFPWLISECHDWLGLTTYLFAWLTWSMSYADKTIITVVNKRINIPYLQRIYKLSFGQLDLVSLTLFYAWSSPGQAFEFT